MKLSYANSVVIVTGGASGIGRATCLQLAEEGAAVAALDIHAEAVQAVANTINEKGGKALALGCDISDPEQVKAAVERVVAELGAPNALFNIAGVVKFSRSEDLDAAAFNRVVGINLVGAFLMSQAAMPHLIANRGSIVNVASMAGNLGVPYGAAYSASKGGLIALTKSMAKEYADRGVRINAIAPSGVETPMAAVPFPKDANPDVLRLIPFTPLGYAKPEEIAAVILLLGAKESGVISGALVPIDGAST
jgi:NAD(P)-dependent dehydrogenase (short-subunit alcohol dehydrogenase family)